MCIWMSETRTASGKQSSLQLGETRQSGAEDLCRLSQQRAPSPTQDVSYPQGQPRVKGKQGLGRSRTREGDVTSTLSNALAEAEAPTLGGRERRRGSAGASS